MSSIYSGMPHLQGHLLCAVDFETTGSRPGYHEPIQIAVVPLDSDLKPIESVRPFYRYIRPDYPERAEPAATRVHKIDINWLRTHALPQDVVADLFREWFENLNLPFKKVLIPLAHNWPFEYGFFGEWLGIPDRDNLFHSHARDAMIVALGKNDAAFYRGEPPPFESYVSLSHLCRQFGVVNQRPHDAYHDCLAEAEVYRHLINMDIL